MDKKSRCCVPPWQRAVAVVVCADWVAGYHLNSRLGQPALNLRPSYRRAAVAGCYLTRQTPKSARTHPIMRKTFKQDQPSFGNIRRQMLNLTCHCPIAQLSRGWNVRTSSCPPPRLPAIGPNRPPCPPLVLTGAWPRGPKTGRQKQFHRWAAECVSHKRFSLPRKMPPHFLEAGQDLSCICFLGKHVRDYKMVRYILVMSFLDF